jgi:hypothetical protein
MGKVLIQNEVITITNANQLYPLSSTALSVNDFDIFVVSSNSGASVVLGSSLTMTTSNAIPLLKNSVTNFTSGTGKPYQDEYFDLNKIYVTSGTAGDAVMIRYKILDV